ncbi:MULTISPECIES: methyltransferase family protein [unclassified Marinimicrobium]|uniref:methyltransferase family protein n=1 Tax=unclassified Marinimicrobium TaxID=2632100 RepID=UPI000C61F70F|nr:MULTISPECIES: methyltransferase [unclassified Marinimicrobium]MAN51031.1 protein-S-isoprenylcysteine methyltransferase [Marinimicrobium sp.]|tara:strand:- start:28 stop:633 length:606 start_codon:yes stop_codon:yes gene_type:complete
MYDIDQLSRHFLGLYFLFIGVHYTSTSVGLWKRTGISHIRYGNRGSATWWYRQTFNLFRAAILGVCLARIVWPIDPWLGVFPALYQAPVLLAGMAMLLVSYGIVSYVHAYMRNDWRSGIDPDKRQPLLTQGPYGLTRNPLFIGIILGQLGLFLTFPSVFTLLCLLVGAVVIVLQARREEVALGRAYGVEYQDYRLLVRRWL